MLDKKSKSFIILIIICICLSFPYVALRDNHTFIIFCDVGQGDGIYIRIHDTYDIIIDAGPNNAILECLGKYMPFYDRTIDVAIMTHPQEDHIAGFEGILTRYTVQMVIMSRLTNTSKLFSRIVTIINNQHIPVSYIKAGDILDFGRDKLIILWPTLEFQNEHIIDTGNNMRLSRLDDNDFSVIALLKEGSQSVLLTGDASPSVLGTFAQKDLNQISILKVPHHGSINGLSHYFLSLANPQLSVISVGKNNTFKHPSQEIITMLEKNHNKYMRTDQHGSIRITLFDSFFKTDSEK